MAIIIGIMAPPKRPWRPLNNIKGRKLYDIAPPMLEIIKPNKLIKKKNLVDNNLINKPLKGIIITSAISDADITYEICSTLAFNSPCKYFKEEPTSCALIIFNTKPLSKIKNINKFFLLMIIEFYSRLNK